MEMVGIAVLSVVLWWVCVLAWLFLPDYWQAGHIPGEWRLALPAVLVVGAVYSLPMAVYLALLGVVARLLSFPGNVAVFVLGVALWALIVLALAAASDDPEPVRELATVALLASAPGAAVFLLRLILARPRRTTS